MFIRNVYLIIEADFRNLMIYQKSNLKFLEIEKYLFFHFNFEILLLNIFKFCNLEYKIILS